MRLQPKSAAAVLACFLVFLLLLFPARAAFFLFAPEGASAFGISGTLWNGNIQLLRFGNTQLRDTRWDLALAQLLLGQVGADIETRWNGGFVNGFASAGLNGKLVIRDARGAFDASALQAPFGTPPIRGQLSLTIERLELRDRWPVYLVGTAELRDLSSLLLGNGADGKLGSFAVSFDSTTETEADSLTGKITDTGGPLEVSGVLLLTPPAQYSLKARLKPRTDTSMALRRSLDFLGAPEPDGSRVFQFAGSF